MKIWKFFASGISFEVGLSEWMMLGYICALIPIITLLIIIPRLAIYYDEIRTKIRKLNKPLVFAYDLQKNNE